MRLCTPSFDNCSIVEDNNSTGYNSSDISPENNNGTNLALVGGITISILCSICIFIHVGILFSIWRLTGSRKIKAVNLLHGNLSVVAIYCSTFSIVSIFTQNKEFTGNFLCSFFTTVRVIGSNLLPPSVLFLSYERLRKLKPRLRKISGKAMLLSIWSIAIIPALPSAWTTEYSAETCLCEKISTNFRITYQILLCIFFHIMPAGILIFELYEVRSKFKYFYKFKSTRGKKVGRVRFLYCNSVTFISTWVPFGITRVTYEVTRQQPTTSDIKEYHTILLFLSGFFFIYVMSLPVILFWTSDLFKHKKPGQITRRAFQSRRTNETTGIEEIRMSQLVSSDFSRYSTTGRSEHNNGGRGKLRTSPVPPPPPPSPEFDRKDETLPGSQQVSVEVHI